MFFIRWVAICVLWLGGFSIIAQEMTATDTPEPRLVYEKTLDDGSLEIVTLTETSTYRYHVSSEKCYRLSPSLDRIAISQKENPLWLKVVDLTTNKTVAQVNWPDNWTTD